MVKEAPLLQYDAEQRIAANEGGFGFLAEMRAIRAEMAKMNDKIQKLESHSQKVESHRQKLESHRQSHLDIRQRAISTWVRDALNKDTERRKEEIRRLNKDVIHGGDVRSDAMVVTERYKKSSTEWKSFRTLYGLTPDNVNDLGIAYKFPSCSFYR
jgi:DNA repair exonuclease SbcCD ATPase subunit